MQLSGTISIGKFQAYRTIEDATTSLPLLLSPRNHGFYHEAPLRGKYLSLSHCLLFLNYPAPVLDLPHCGL